MGFISQVEIDMGPNAWYTVYGDGEGARTPLKAGPRETTEVSWELCPPLSPPAYGR